MTLSLGCKETFVFKKLVGLVSRDHHTLNCALLGEAQTSFNQGTTNCTIILEGFQDSTQLFV